MHRHIIPGISLFGRPERNDIGDNLAGFGFDLNVERVEVVRGPSSVAYGSDALGGVINIITREALPSSMNNRGLQGSVNMGGSIRYELTVPKGATRRIALALCEGWWNETGKRVQVLRVEGAEPKTVDTVADI